MPKCYSDLIKDASLFSVHSFNSYNVLNENTYFTKADYIAACKRVYEKRINYDILHNKTPCTEPVKKKKPVKGLIINGTFYDTVASASRTYKMSASGVMHRVNSEKYSDWTSIND